MDTGLVILCIAIMGVALQQRSVPLMFASLMCWLGFAAYMLEQWNIAYGLDNTTPTWTSDRMFSWVGIALAVLNVFFILRFSSIIGRTEAVEVSPEDTFIDEYGQMVDNMNRLRSLRPRKHKA
jgi:hypothetical protein